MGKIELLREKMKERKNARAIKPLNRAQLPCRFLGKETGEISVCKTCTGRVEIKVLECEKFGKCSVLKKADNVANCCATCNSYQVKPSSASVIEPVEVPVSVAPLGVGWSGNVSPAIHSYSVTVAIPHLNTLPQLRLALDLWRMQTMKPYFVIVDTGSPWDVCAEMDKELRANDCEVHFIRANGYRHSSAPVTHALDLAHSICRTPYLFHTHGDVFPVRRDMLAFLQAQCSADTPVVGWQMSPRSHTKGSATRYQWAECVSHTATMIHTQTAFTKRLHWSMEAYYARRPHERRNTAGWPDTESSFLLAMQDAGLKPLLLGPESNDERHTLECAGIVWADHARSYASRKAQSETTADAGGWMANAEADARKRLEQWRAIAG